MKFSVIFVAAISLVSGASALKECCCEISSGCDCVFGYEDNIYCPQSALNATMQLPISIFFLFPALVFAGRRLNYHGSCIISGGTWSTQCTPSYIESQLKSQCSNLGGELSNINYETSVTQIDFRCLCVRDSTKDFTYDDGIFTAKATVGEAC
ncbi:hypothetical protein Cob_v004850 [Colletotrichum orbiculare MAFF 240422]|uniref:Uncharacterized protein n=1 Tax=Colletotrichum orbiculare (strain 104-T / ATCC 96160 / CBS 514.97 / LARS 414 / MAFF 240422) TaxID=1213857 RepID=A0A484FX33_COLOR|nr:hypothetical protein Cob_v004850 [Colletotrichum orbiculare MAFF 240422]